MCAINNDFMSDNSRYLCEDVADTIFNVQVYCRIKNLSLASFLENAICMEKINSGDISSLILIDNSINIISFPVENGRHVVVFDSTGGVIRLFDVQKGECCFFNSNKFLVWFDLYVEIYKKKRLQK